MTAEIDAYYALQPSAYTDLVSIRIEPSARVEPYGLLVTVVLTDPEDRDRTLTLSFDGVSDFNLEEFSGPSVPFLEIASTRERGWENPRFLISGDQGRLRFGCMSLGAAATRP